MNTIGRELRIAIIFVQLAYLLMDWAAMFVVGLIYDKQNIVYTPYQNSDLLYIPIDIPLGPNTLDTFSLEHYALWFRHLFGGIFHVTVAGYVFPTAIPV